LMSEGGSGSGTATTPTTTPPTTTPTSTTPPTTLPAVDDRCEICSAIGDAIVDAVDAAAKVVDDKVKGAKDAIKNFLDSLTPTDPLPPLSPEKATGPSGAGAAVVYEWQLIKAAPTFNDGVRSILDDRIAQYCAAGDLSPGECKTMENLGPDEKRQYLSHKGLKDCADPNECDSGCTTLNEQVMKQMQACEQQLESELGPDPVDPLDPVINPGPDATDGHAPADPLAACMVGPDDGQHFDKTCGVVTCADGLASMRTLNQCCQAGGRQGRRAEPRPDPHREHWRARPVRRRRDDRRGRRRRLRLRRCGRRTVHRQRPGARAAARAGALSRRHPPPVPVPTRGVSARRCLATDHRPVGFPEKTRQALIDQGNQILADMKTLLGTVEGGSRVGAVPRPSPSARRRESHETCALRLGSRLE